MFHSCKLGIFVDELVFYALLFKILTQTFNGCLGMAVMHGFLPSAARQSSIWAGFTQQLTRRPVLRGFGGYDEPS